MALDNTGQVNLQSTTKDNIIPVARPTLATSWRTIKYILQGNNIEHQSACIKREASQGDRSQGKPILGNGDLPIAEMIMLCATFFAIGSIFCANTEPSGSFGQLLATIALVPTVLQGLVFLKKARLGLSHYRKIASRLLNFVDSCLERIYRSPIPPGCKSFKWTCVCCWHVSVVRECIDCYSFTVRGPSPRPSKSWHLVLVRIGSGKCRRIREMHIVKIQQG